MLLRIALRSHVAGLLGVTLVATVFALGNTFGFAALVGESGPERAVFARQMELVGRQLSYMLPVPLELDTLAGYLEWRHYGTLPLVYGFWALLSGTGAGRGDEERGLVEQWLAAGAGRARYLLTRALAFTLVAAASIAVMSAAVMLGALVTAEPLAVDAVALKGLALLAFAVSSFAIALAAAQLPTTRRAAMGIAGAVLGTTFLINSMSRNGGLQELQAISPFWAYERSDPLLRAGSFDVPATLGLLAAAALLIAFAVLAFARRDLGAPLLRLTPPTGAPVSRPSRDPFLRRPVLALLDRQRASIAGWSLAIAAVAAFMISLTRTMVDALLAIPTMRVFFERFGSGGVGYETFIAVIWGTTVMLLITVFAIGVVDGWVDDDTSGRLETMLAQPVSRARVSLERVAAMVISSAMVVLAGSIGVWVSAANEGIALDAQRFATASALMITVPFAFGAIGAALVGYRPRIAVPVLAAVAVASWFSEQFAPIFDLPEWATQLSLFALYGTPLSTGVEWGGLAALTVIGAAGTGLSVLTMRRRDVGR